MGDDVQAGKPRGAYQPEQALPPPDPRDWLPPGRLVWFVSDVVDELNLGAIEALKLGRATPTTSGRRVGDRRRGSACGSRFAPAAAFCEHRQ